MQLPAKRGAMLKFKRGLFALMFITVPVLFLQLESQQPYTQHQPSSAHASASLWKQKDGGRLNSTDASKSSDDKPASTPRVWRRLAVNPSSSFGVDDRFVDLQQAGVYTFHNVCVVEAIDNSDIEVQPGKSFDLRHIQPKQLVVYDAANDTERRLQVNASWHDYVEWQAWNFTFTTSPIPSEFSYVDDYPAYFAITTCDNNLFHFWHDHARDLFTALKLTNRLRPQHKNQLLYKEPIWDALPLRSMRDCMQPARFEDLLLAMPFRLWHDTFHKLPHGTCFRDAVFGSPQMGAAPGEAEDFVAESTSTDNHPCDRPRVTFIQRQRTRILLNMDQLYAAVRRLGFRNVNVYNFETLSTLEQLRVVRCTDVLIGVHGQGLAWHTFMRRGGRAAIVEIAWPHQHWPFYYASRARQYGQSAAKVTAKRVQPDWDAWNQWFTDTHHRLPDESEMQGALNGNTSRGDWGSVWKFADAEVDVTTFVKEFSRVAEEVKLQPE